MRAILTRNAPQPRGHYSQALVHNGIVYISGILPIDPQSEEQKVGPIEMQIHQVLDNLYGILISSDSEVNRVLKVTVYISDIELWGKVNDIYSKFFANHRPARTIVPTNELHFGYQIELDAIAALSE